MTKYKHTCSSKELERTIHMRKEKETNVVEKTNNRKTTSTSAYAPVIEHFFSKDPSQRLDSHLPMRGRIQFIIYFALLAYRSLSHVRRWNRAQLAARRRATLDYRGWLQRTR